MKFYWDNFLNNRNGQQFFLPTISVNNFSVLRYLSICANSFSSIWMYLVYSLVGPTGRPPPPVYWLLSIIHGSCTLSVDSC